MSQHAGDFSFILSTVQSFSLVHTHWKQFLGGMRSNEDMKKTVKDWFNILVPDFYNTGIQKLITRYDKCQSLHADYAEK
jgi:hypothetical protein